MARRRPGGLLVLAAVAVLAAACGGGSGGRSSDEPVQLSRIRPAMAKVESELGGPQVFSEVNATPSEVNVFVVRDGSDFAYVVRGDGVEAPAHGEPYDGPTFTSAQVAFEDAVLDTVVAQLPDSPVVAFSVTPNQTGGVDYIATVRATAGQLRVLLDAGGGVLGIQ